MVLEEQIARLPKIELHRHLEGCITPDYLIKHLQQYNPNHSLNQADQIDDLFRYSDFMDFLNAWGTVMDLLTSEEQFRGLARAVIKQLAREKIVYAELIFSPEPFDNMGLDTEVIFDILYEELYRASTRTSIIVDFVRNFGEKSTASYLEKLIQMRKNNDELANWIRAISIGGDEVNYPAPLFAQSFQLARQNGFHLYAHAGEWVGPQSIWDAINVLGVERIGHGINAIHDPVLLKYLKENHIGLDMSITSNYLTGALSEDEVHPVKQVIHEGCHISINTDDPGFFHTDLNQECNKFIDLGFTMADLKRIQRHAVNQSFLKTDEQEQLISLLE